MEIRLVVISESGQTTPYEFKSFKEAGDFCYKVVSRDEEAINVLNNGFETHYSNGDMSEVDLNTISSSNSLMDYSQPESSEGVMHTLRRRFGLDN